MPKLGIKEQEIVKISKKSGLSVLENIFMKLSIEEKTKQTKITEMLAINKQSDENITVEII